MPTPAGGDLAIPSGLKVRYNYDVRGYVTSLSDDVSHASL